MSMFNEDQQDYMRSLRDIPPDQKCWCAWFRIGECPHCPEGMTAEMRAKVECPDCHNYPDARTPDKPATHQRNCPRATYYAVDPAPFGRLNVPNPDFLHQELTSYDNAPTDPHHGGKIWKE